MLFISIVQWLTLDHTWPSLQYINYLISKANNLTNKSQRPLAQSFVSLSNNF